MSVYLAKRKDGTLKSPYWQFDFVLKVNGERRRFHGSTGETKEKDARAFVAREKTRLKSQGPRDDMTLAAACYLYDQEVSQHRPSGDDMATAYEHCCRLIGGARKLINITAADISQAVRRRSAETYGKNRLKLVLPGTVNRQIVEPMQRLLRRAQSVWNVNCNPAAIAWKDLKMKEPEGRARELATEEGKAFWAALRPDYLPFVLFLAQRGFRVRAAIGMQKFDVDLARQTANVWKKGKGKVKMRLTAYHCDLIRAEMKKCPSSPVVWTYEVWRGPDKGVRRPITYSGLRQVIRKTLDEIGIADFHIHDLRHDFASKMLRNCRDLAAVQKAMAHSDIKSTLRYAHVLDDDVAAAMNMMPVPEWSRNANIITRRRRNSGE